MAKKKDEKAANAVVKVEPEEVVVDEDPAWSGDPVNEIDPKKASKDLEVQIETMRVLARTQGINQTLQTNDGLLTVYQDGTYDVK